MFYLLIFMISPVKTQKQLTDNHVVCVMTRNNPFRSACWPSLIQYGFLIFVNNSHSWFCYEYFDKRTNYMKNNRWRDHLTSILEVLPSLTIASLVLSNTFCAEQKRFIWNRWNVIVLLLTFMYLFIIRSAFINIHNLQQYFHITSS